MKNLIDYTEIYELNFSNTHTHSKITSKLRFQLVYFLIFSHSNSFSKDFERFHHHSVLPSHHRFQTSHELQRFFWLNLANPKLNFNNI